MTNTQEKKTYATEIKPNDNVITMFLCQRKGNFIGKTGQPYITLDLVDKTGNLDAKIWDNVEVLDKAFNEGDYVKVKAKATTYNGKIQLRVQKIRKIDDSEIDPADFLPVSPYDLDEMAGELRNVFEAIENFDIRRLVMSFLDDEAFMAQYKLAPAAKGIHHPYLGGLIEHTLSLAKLAKLLASHYVEIDESLLLAGVFFHDIGKVRELSYDRAMGYTDEGRLIGHINLGVEMLNERIQTLEDFPADMKMLITHMILAHHGLLEFGSPKRPKIIEAHVLSVIDDLDARIYSFSSILEEETRNGRWSNYQRLYDRYLYRWQGGESLNEAETPEAKAPRESAQKSESTAGKAEAPKEAESKKKNEKEKKHEPLDLFKTKG